MAKTRSRSRKKNQTPNNPLNLLLKPEVVGLSLMGLGLLTALSLLSVNQGNVTAAWIEFLVRMVGWGRYIVWFAFMSLGWWFIRRYGSEDDDEKWEKPVGTITMLLVLLTAFNLISPGDDPISTDVIGGGGVTGWVLGNLIVSAIGTAGSWVILSLLFILCIVLISGLSLRELGVMLRDLYFRFQDWRQFRKLPINRPIASPPTPPVLPKPRPKMLERLIAARRPKRSSEPAVILGDEPLINQPEADIAAGEVGAMASAQAVPRSSMSVTAIDPDTGQPAAHQWHLPLVTEILEESIETEISTEEIRDRARIIDETFASFGIQAKVREINPGPAVTQFSVEPGATKDAKGNKRRVRVSKIVNLSNDLALALSAAPIRIEAPIPGRPYVGIEVPNAAKAIVPLRSALESGIYHHHKGALRIALGRNVSGQPVVVDLTQMPHLLIAGATGAGKSVCVNAIIACLLCNHTPDTVRFLMIDPKMVELIAYNGIPHLLAPVVTELERVVGVLSWATREMDRRYKAFSKVGARNIESYNQKVGDDSEEKLPYIIIIIDELADLMMMAPDEVERTIQRIAQMARATGIHLIIATQRPSVDVVTGLIKANFPARIAFAVSSQIDSRVILDTPGAERLLGKGDMLYMAPDSAKLQRLQGVFVSEKELDRLIKFWGGGVGVRRPLTVSGPVSDPGPLEQKPLWEDLTQKKAAEEADKDEALLNQAIEVVRKHGRASVSLLQRRLRIGYSRAARLIDQLENMGIIGPDRGGGKAREILMDEDSNETNEEAKPTSEENEDWDA